MEPICLLNDTEKYSGEYVAIRSFTEARDLGVDEPVVFYVPEKDVIQIY